MQGEHPNTSPGRSGETLGSGLEGGKGVILHAGYIVHIPAGVPPLDQGRPRHHNHLLGLQRKITPAHSYRFIA